MRVGLLRHLRCPGCRQRLALDGAVADGEAQAGWLVCAACGRRSPITDGIPRLLDAGLGHEAPMMARTAETYGYLWRRSASRDGTLAYHFDRLQQALSLSLPHGLVLDAGCGEGIDLANQARRPGLEIIGVELSEWGCQVSAQRTRGFPSAAVVQGDLRRLPFADGTFDFIYSYGVLHHLPDPTEGVRELVRVLKFGARVAVYLYEDFSDRGAGWRWLLGLVNALRPITTRMPPPLLEALCRAAAPVVFLAFALPSRIAQRMPGGKRLAAAMPFRHAEGLWSLWGDLFDRFATPIERRYSRAEAVTLFCQAGLQDVVTARDRGWMVSGSKG